MNPIVLREAVAADVPAMTVFIFEHAANQWNHLPEEEITAHLAAIGKGRLRALIAEIGGELRGFVTFMASRSMMRYQSIERIGYLHGYVCEVVVHREQAGNGIGTRLLDAAVACLADQGLAEVYIERHEQNAASAGMMRKAEFIEVDTFPDPKRRAFGSRRTTVCRRLVAPGVNKGTGT